MNCVRANIGDRISEGSWAQEVLKIIIDKKMVVNQVWFNYMRIPTNPGFRTSYRVTIFLAKISSKVEIEFESYNEALEFMIDINITDFSMSDSEVHEIWKAMRREE